MMRIPPFAATVRDDCPNDRVPELIVTEDPGPDEDVPEGSRSCSFRPDDGAMVPPRRPKGFLDAFSESVGKDIRTKPSYADTWMLPDSEDMAAISTYATESARVTVGTCGDGQSEYRVLPREYGYSDGLNRIVCEVIEGIRERHRLSGGSLDRGSVMGVARIILAGMHDRVTEECGDPEAVADDICRIAHRHSVGAGIFDVLLSDPHIEDVYVDAPCGSNRIHVTMNGVDGLNSHMRCRTNMVADPREVDNLVNILRRESGLRFCRSSPVMETDFRGYDARATVIGPPMSPEGTAVAIRKHSVRPWTLPRLIANGTVDPEAAGLLSFLVNNRCTMLICGARGSGKSSLLSALMFEFPLGQRILTIEDTAELPGEAMRRMGYKVQTILVDDRMSGTQASRSNEALRVSLRMGESAIVLGEVRGGEARTLYQSMRTGRAGSSIMGTIHGDSARSVYERVVHDMGIPPEAFAATDVVVTLGTVRDRRSGHLIRRVNEIVATGVEPGDFVDMSDTESLYGSPAVRRAMSMCQKGRREISREIRSRGLMRSVLADLGRTDEAFLGPGWVLRANEFLARCPASSSPEETARMFREAAEAEG